MGLAVHGFAGVGVNFLVKKEARCRMQDAEDKHLITTE